MSTGQFPKLRESPERPVDPRNPYGRIVNSSGDRRSHRQRALARKAAVEAILKK